MNNTSYLVNNYYKFFCKDAPEFIISPYSMSVQGNFENWRPLVLLTIIPVLPTLTAITMALTLSAMVIAAASTFVTIPSAFVIDMCSENL